MPSGIRSEGIASALHCDSARMPRLVYFQYRFHVFQSLVGNCSCKHERNSSKTKKQRAATETIFSTQFIEKTLKEKYVEVRKEMSIDLSCILD